MRMLFFLLILVHGMIHVLGFVKGFGFKEVKGLTMPITKSKGLLWLLAALLILVFAWLYGANAKFAWIVGFVAMGLSQVLVFVYWRDAKFGTLPKPFYWYPSQWLRLTGFRPESRRRPFN